MKKDKLSGPGEEVSREYIRMNINNNLGKSLDNIIKRQFEEIDNINWNINSDIDSLNNFNLTLSGKSDSGLTILVETKYCIEETSIKNHKISEGELKELKDLMKNTYENLVTYQRDLSDYDIRQWAYEYEDVWLNKFYKFACILSYMHRLKKQGITAKLIIVDVDKKLKESLKELELYYNEVRGKMGITSCELKDVVLVQI